MGWGTGKVMMGYLSPSLCITAVADNTVSPLITTTAARQYRIKRFATHATALHISPTPTLASNTRSPVTESVTSNTFSQRNTALYLHTGSVMFEFN